MRTKTKKYLTSFVNYCFSVLCLFSAFLWFCFFFCMLFEWIISDILNRLMNSFKTHIRNAKNSPMNNTKSNKAWKMYIGRCESTSNSTANVICVNYKQNSWISKNTKLIWVEKESIWKIIIFVDLFFSQNV